MKISKFLKMLPFALVACMLLSTVSAFAAVSSSYGSDKKVTVVVSDVTEGEEVAIMVYDKAEGVTPANVEADNIWYIDQAAAGADGTVTFTFYLKNGAGDAEKQVAIGKATGSAADTSSTFTVVAETPSYTPGDVDGSGTVDTNDLLLLAKHTANWDVTIAIQAADVDGSGVVDTNDLLLLAKYTANWEVTLVPGNVTESE